MPSYVGVYILSFLTGLLLLLNGLGFFGLTAIHIITEYQGYGSKLHHMALGAYSLITIIAYFLTFPFADAITNPIGMVAKTIELIIVIASIRFLRAKQ